MANSMNFYFKKRLFENYNDFEKKQIYNFKVTKQKYQKYDCSLSKKIRFSEIWTMKNNRKKSMDFYFTMTHIFLSKKFWDRETAVVEFFQKLKICKYVVIYTFICSSWKLSCFFHPITNFILLLTIL